MESRGGADVLFKKIHYPSITDYLFFNGHPDTGPGSK